MMPVKKGRIPFTISTKKSEEIVDITDRVNSLINGQSGFTCHLFVLHTTCALTVADLDPGTDLDILEAFREMVPAHQSEGRHGRAIRYRHPHDPNHAPDHILSALVGPSLLVPVEHGKLALGTWQRVILCEFDGPRERQLVLSMI